MKYWIVVENAKEGPFSIKELMAFNLNAESWIWRDGLTEWTHAKEVPEVIEMLNNKKEYINPSVPEGQILNVGVGESPHEGSKLTTDQNHEMEHIENVEIGLEGKKKLPELPTMQTILDVQTDTESSKKFTEKEKAEMKEILDVQTDTEAQKQ